MIPRLLFVIFFTTSSILLNAQQIDLAGIWSGKLSLPNTIKLMIVFNLQKENADKYNATLDSPDQGAKGIPTESVTIKEDSILIKVPAIAGSFEGKIFTDSMKIDGKWKQSGMTLDLTVYKVDKVEEAKRPQEPKKPFPYKVEDVKFDNNTCNITLAGTLTMPMKDENFSTLILISGSGGQNRNEEIFGHKPFLVIAII